MANVISTRMKEKEIKILNEISKKEHIDRSSLIRKFLIQQIQEYKMKESAEKYRKGLVSMAEAASLANVSIYAIMEFCQREQITAPQPSENEIKQEMKHAQQIFKKLKN